MLPSFSSFHFKPPNRFHVFYHSNGFATQFLDSNIFCKTKQKKTENLRNGFFFTWCGMVDDTNDDCNTSRVTFWLIRRWLSGTKPIIHYIAHKRHGKLKLLLDHKIIVGLHNLYDFILCFAKEHFSFIYCAGQFCTATIRR